MNKKRNLWILAGVLIFISAAVSGFILLVPSAEDILVSVLETAESVTTSHAVVEIEADTVEKSGSATVEVWGRRSEGGPGAFRLEVLETSEEKAVGGVLVSDGHTVWAYAPADGKAFTGTLEEAKALLAKKHALGEGPSHDSFDPDVAEHPQNAEEAVQKLLEYFLADRAGSEEIAGEQTYRLKLTPIAEQMPAKYAAVGGSVNLWIDQDRRVPLRVEYTGGSLGDLRVTVHALELNPELAESLFSFEIPTGIEVLGFADLEPQSLSLDEAVEAADFPLLSPAAVPEGATLVDVLDVGGTIVQRYALPAGGSFSIAQGASTEAHQAGAEAQAVSVGEVEGSLFTSEDGDKTLLTWTVDGVSYTIAGDITPEDALMVAESLR